MKRGAAHAKRGRPPKFGRPARLVAVTLPEDVVRGLKRVHSDLGWAIVSLFQQRSQRAVRQRLPPGDSALVTVAHNRSLIVVNRAAFKELPGINLIPLYEDRAFLALDRDAGVADLELSVIDRMARRSVGRRERTALAALRAQVRQWRSDPALRCRMQSIIVIERARR